MVIGICGKSGSGKSLVCRKLETMGAYVIDADVIGRDIMSGEVLEDVRRNFPECFENDILNRKKLAALVFNDAGKLKILNGITHPAIRRQIQTSIDLVKSEYNYVVVDAAVLIEAGMLDMFDFTVAVVADDGIRIDRIVDRDAVSEELADLRISAQKSDAFYIDNTDFYIINNGDLSPEDLAYKIIERSKYYETKHS